MGFILRWWCVDQWGYRHQIFEYFGFPDLIYWISTTHWVVNKELHESFLRITISFISRHVYGKGSTIASMIDSSTRGQTPSCIAGVVNTGDQFGWCGNVFNQANWHAFGRLSWSSELGPKRIAEEWAQMTFGADMVTQEKIVGLLMNSYDYHLNYSSLFGLNILHDRNHDDPKPKIRSSYHGANESGLEIG